MWAAKLHILKHNYCRLIPQIYLYPVFIRKNCPVAVMVFQLLHSLLICFLPFFVPFLYLFVIFLHGLPTNRPDITSVCLSNCYELCFVHSYEENSAFHKKELLKNKAKRRLANEVERMIN